MSALESRIDSSSEEFAANAAYMQAYVDRVRTVMDKQLETELAYGPRAHEKGKLLPRERLSRLLDPGAPFVELCPLAGYGMGEDSDGRFSGGKLIAGIGFISRRRCLVVVWNYAIKGGTIDSVNVTKMLRLQEIAFGTRLPVVSLHESGGGNLSKSSEAMDPWGARLFVEGGRIYGQQAELSAAGIPQITVSHGNATAGGAYQVALSDYIVLVRGQTQLFLAGPPLLKAGTGEEARAEDLGGAAMHATVSGTGEYLAEDDADALRITREIVAQLPPDPTFERARVEPPRYSPDELIGIFPENRRKPVWAQEIIARIVDGSRFDEISAPLDAATVCGTARIGGKQVGIISNNGPITPAGANKASQFIELCDLRRTPLVFLQNTTGFLVGTEVERAGQVKHSAKLIQHVANTRSPKVTVLIGNSFGAGNYAMASRALKPDFVVSWPSARQALMGGAQAGQVMKIVTEGKWAREGVEPNEKQRAGLEQQSRMIEMGLEMLSESMFTSARIMDDGIIDPRDTRRVLSFLLDVCLEARLRGAADEQLRGAKAVRGTGSLTGPAYGAPFSYIGDVSESELLRAVLEAPEADAPRLVYADLLLGRGDSRGELIGIQIQLARQRLTDQRRMELEGVAHALVRHHTGLFLSAYADLNAACSFRRGFVEQLTAPAAALVSGKGFGELMGCEPVRELVLLQMNDDAAQAIAESTLMLRIMRLTCRGVLSARGAAALAGSQNLRNLVELDLAGSALGEEGCAVLASSTSLCPTSWALNATGAGDGGAVALASGAALRSCRRLALARNRIGRRGGQALAQSKVLERLELLTLTGNRDLCQDTRASLSARFGPRVRL